MKVTGQQPAVLQDIKGGQRKEADQAHLKDGPPSADDSVKTSSFAMDKLKLRISAEPEVRSEKVAELKAKIARVLNVTAASVVLSARPASIIVSVTVYPGGEHES